MPQAFVLHLSPKNKIYKHPYLSKYAHGLFYALLEKISPNLSAEVHAKKRNPFTLWAKESKNGTVFLRITLLDDDLFMPILGQFLDQSLKEISLGQDSYKIAKVIATPEGHKDAGFCSWDEIITAKPSKALGVLFLSPTVFSTSKLGGAKRHYTPLPEPKLVFKSLLKSYQVYSSLPHSGKELVGLEHELEQMMIITSHDIKTKLAQVGKTKLIGFVGRAGYKYQGDSATVKTALGQMAKLAFYSGVGAKTPYGMGQIRVYKQY